ncbi:uncharacterized protein DS421_17g594880 [Arachis hypogaea]|nr:uncharacterized protein DS421_17g594880 [Arachis hypogaea]
MITAMNKDTSRKQEKPAKAKDTTYTEQWGTKKYSMQEEKAKKEKNAQVLKSVEGEQYFVELASDEDAEENMEEQEQKESTKWEIELARCIEMGLNLKRKREDKEMLQITNVEWDKMLAESEKQAPKRMKNGKEGEYKLVNTRNIGGEPMAWDNAMAEEAGLIMPHPQP